LKSIYKQERATPANVAADMPTAMVTECGRGFQVIPHQRSERLTRYSHGIVWQSQLRRLSKNFERLVGSAELSFTWLACASYSST
jgi:hypothetical protein